MSMEILDVFCTGDTSTASGSPPSLTSEKLVISQTDMHNAILVSPNHPTVQFQHPPDSSARYNAQSGAARVQHLYCPVQHAHDGVGSGAPHSTTAQPHHRNDVLCAKRSIVGLILCDWYIQNPIAYAHCE
jgi:hypothetical protein